MDELEFSNLESDGPGRRLIQSLMSCRPVAVPTPSTLTPYRIHSRNHAETSLGLPKHAIFRWAICTGHSQNMKEILLAVFAAFTLSSCQTFYSVDSSGTAVINTNKFKLPQVVDGSKRVYVRAFDGAGYNVGSGYNNDSNSDQAALTIYVMSVASGRAPTRDEAEGHFSAAASEIQQAHAGATVISTSSITGHGGTGMLREFRYDENFAGHRQSLYSLLAVFRDQSRLVKYRMTGPLAKRAQLKQAFSRSVRTFSRTNDM